MIDPITLTAADGHQLAAYVARPLEKPKAAVVVLQEIFGVNSHIQSVADRYAAEGFLAVAPAMFDRVRTGVALGYTGPDMDQGRQLKAEVEALEADVDAEAAEVLADVAESSAFPAEALALAASACADVAEALA
jgi:carboxymethylenebutenolidase